MQDQPAFQFSHLDLPATNLIIRAVVVYFFILVLLRISGKRQVGQMGATELVSLLLVSNAVQNSMNGGDNSLLGGMILAAILIFLSMIISYATFKSRKLGALIEGSPRLLIHDGKLIPQALEKELLSRSDLGVLMRKQGIQHANEVKTAVLEADGTLSIIRFADLEPKKS